MSERVETVLRHRLRQELPHRAHAGDRQLRAPRPSPAPSPPRRRPAARSGCGRRASSPSTRPRGPARTGRGSRAPPARRGPTAARLRRRRRPSATAPPKRPRPAGCARRPGPPRARGGGRGPGSRGRRPAPPCGRPRRRCVRSGAGCPSPRDTAEVAVRMTARGTSAGSGSGRPSTAKPTLQVSPPIGTWFTKAALSTPGTAWTACSSPARNAGRRSPSARGEPESDRVTARRPSDRKPVSGRCSRRKLLTRRPAPTSSTTASANSPITSASCRRWRAPAARQPLALLERRHEVGARGPQRRHQARDDPGDDGEGEREGGHPRVHGDLLDPRQGHRPQPRERRDAQAGQGQPADPADHRQRDALEEALPHEARGARPERGADRRLLLAGEALGEQQVRDVRAGDQQDEDDRAGQHEERRANLAHHRLLERLEVDPDRRVRLGPRGGEARADHVHLRPRAPRPSTPGAGGRTRAGSAGGPRRAPALKTSGTHISAPVAQNGGSGSRAA